LTLLALDLPVPKTWSEFAERLDKEYFAFLISFAVIATFWYQHHRLFQMVARIDTPTIMANLLSLFAIVLVPFAARALPAAEHENSFGPVMYASTMVLWAIAYVLIVLAAGRGQLWHQYISPTTPGNMIFGAGAALGTFAASIPVAFFSPGTAEYMWLLIPLVATVAGRIRRRLVAAPASAPRSGGR
jgi:uncharacterized membrane protein